MNVLARTSSSLTACIVAIAIVTSPVMAQNAVTTPVPTIPENPAAEESSKPIVDLSGLPELPLAKTGSAFPTAGRNPTLPTASPSPSQPKPSSDNEAPGQSKWIILAALIAAGTVTAIILLLHGGGSDSRGTRPPTTAGTIITAGTPGVTNP